MAAVPPGTADSGSSGEVHVSAEIRHAVRALPEDIDFPAIMTLLSSKHTLHVVDRHVSAIIKVEVGTGRTRVLYGPLISWSQFVLQKFVFQNFSKNSFSAMFSIHTVAIRRVVLRALQTKTHAALLRTALLHSQAAM